jgi:glutamyl-tRNA synthetase
VDRFRALSDFNSQETEKIFKELLAEKELSFGQLGPALRIALTGGLSGPSVFDICSLLGKEHCISRLENSIAKLG